MILSSLILAGSAPDLSRLPASAREMVQVETRKETKTAQKIRVGLNKVCEIYKEGLARSKDPKHRDRLMELQSYVDRRLETEVRHDSVVKIWRNLKLAEPKDKAGFWELSASDLGVRSWSCPEIQEFHDYVGR